MSLTTARALALSRRFCCVEDVELIQQILRGLKPRWTVILGAGSGTMSLAWLEVPYLKPRVIHDPMGQFPQPEEPRWLVSVDHDASALEWERLAWRDAGRLPRAREITFQVTADSVEAAEGFEGPFGFLIVDADHSREGVARDLEAWLPRVAVGGVVMLHDYDALDAPQHWPGVKEAADQHLTLPSWEPWIRKGWSMTWRRAG